MQEYVFGANILENLTTGMYKDSKIIYREYIQNACDQIDKAVKCGLINQNDACIQIWLDQSIRKITIEDNATGIPVAEFRRVLGNIADSDKVIGEDKGFRGIGRLCGLAYCKQLVFVSKAKGENQVSKMICNADKMRELIYDSNKNSKRTATEILNAINHFDFIETDDIESHFFRVEMIDINTENSDLLDFQLIKDYLSFVAPVPYQNSFIYRSDIYKHAEELNQKIDEYMIRLNGETIFKKYSTYLKESTTGDKYDEIYGVYFKEFYNKDKLIAWMWVGESKFQKAIPKINQMRAIRLRKENIQIGGEDTLQKLFKQERGNNYFVGEVFAIDPELIPNSQRDYFNENSARVVFEKFLKEYFDDELHRVYYTGSKINSAVKKIKHFDLKKMEYKSKVEKGAFIDSKHLEKEVEELNKAANEANNAHQEIEKLKYSSSGLLKKVVKRIEINQPEKILGLGIQLHQEKTIEETEKQSGRECISQNTIELSKRRIDRLSQYSKAERKLISKIFSIIMSSTDKNIAEKIIDRIEEELR